MKFLGLASSILACIIFFNIAAHAGDFDDHITTDLKKALELKNFTLLEKYLAKKAKLAWAPCGGHDSGIVEFTAKEFEKMFVQLSENAKPVLRSDPILDPGMNEAYLETEGWQGEYPFIQFGFDFQSNNRRWFWTGGCYSARPESKVATTPILPRPGARAFKDIDAFHTRIIEIVDVRALDALHSYATRNFLIDVKCDQDMVEEKPNGKNISVDEIIERLKKASAEVKEIKFHGVYGANRYLESKGWMGNPFVYFGFSSTEKGWEWTKIAFCKDSLFDIVFRNEQPNRK